jgi:hypothetical protein
MKRVKPNCVEIKLNHNKFKEIVEIAFSYKIISIRFFE